jgi:hypothetical protein
MKKHIKIYLEFFNYCEQDFIPSEISNQRASDIHHIVFKSQGGKDTIENLIALTREEHDQAHFKKEPYIIKEYLFNKHKEFINETISPNNIKNTIRESRHP